MEISAHHEYAATPAAVHAMMTDPQWLSAVVARAGAASHEVSMGTETDIALVHAEIPAPGQIRSFTGPTLAIDQSFSWREVKDGWDGTIRATPAKLPAALQGNATIRPGGPGTVVDYRGQFSVSVPLVGRRLERLAAPEVMSIIDLQQQVGNDWLAGKRG